MYCILVHSRVYGYKYVDPNCKPTQMYYRLDKHILNLNIYFVIKYVWWLNSGIQSTNSTKRAQPVIYVNLLTRATLPSSQVYRCFLQESVLDSAKNESDYTNGTFDGEGYTRSIFKFCNHSTVTCICVKRIMSWYIRIRTIPTLSYTYTSNSHAPFG